MNRPNHFREVEPTIQRGDIAAMYRSRDTDPLAQSLGDMYHPPAIFEHGRETLVAQIKATNEGGIEARLYEVRFPAATYVVAADGWNAAVASPSLARELLLDAASGDLVIRIEKA